MASTLHTYPGTVLPIRNTASKNTELRPIVSSVGPIVQKQLEIWCYLSEPIIMLMFNGAS